jgi:glycogen operon protein
VAKKIAITAGAAGPLGVTVTEDGVNVAVISRNAERLFFCVFEEPGETEIARLPLMRGDDDVHSGLVVGIGPRARYGLRADGPYEPGRGHWFDPAKLLVDPYARALDRPFALHADLAAPRSAGIDTARLVPKAIVRGAMTEMAAAPAAPPRRPGFVYELAIKAFTKKHPAIPAPQRGTAAGLAHPAAIEHLTRLGVDTVELMPVAAWIDERHLPRLGLTNAWGYNPIVFMAPDPRIAPGGIAELRAAVTTLHAAGIQVILDVVYNHTGESDVLGPTLSLRGLDSALYYRHEEDGRLVNDTGCGNTLAAERPPVTRLILDALRLFATETGIDGFRLDLATSLGRLPEGFSGEAPLFGAMRSDPLLGPMMVIAEPWDVGPGGYQLGNFPEGWLEWNDRYRDDVRLFWRGDPARIGGLATRLAGSSDLFRKGNRKPSASVNFIAAHDGFPLRDLVSYGEKHNQSNGEANRDGTDANFSWNNGIEGETPDALVAEARRRDVRSLLATLFVSRGTPMLTAGDEFGRGQRGNNNAYAQDNDITWLDWAKADTALATFVAALIRLRGSHAALSEDRFLDGAAVDDSGIKDVVWLNPAGDEMGGEDWSADVHILGAVFYAGETIEHSADRVAIWINGGRETALAALPQNRDDHFWELVLDTSAAAVATPSKVSRAQVFLPARSVLAFAEKPDLS